MEPNTNSPFIMTMENLKMLIEVTQARGANCDLEITERVRALKNSLTLIELQNALVQRALNQEQS